MHDRVPLFEVIAMHDRVPDAALAEDRIQTLRHHVHQPPLLAWTLARHGDGGDSPTTWRKEPELPKGKDSDCTIIVALALHPQEHYYYYYYYS